MSNSLADRAIGGTSATRHDRITGLPGHFVVHNPEPLFGVTCVGVAYTGEWTPAVGLPACVLQCVRVLVHTF